MLIEDAASGRSLIQELRSGTSLPLRPVRADRDRLARLAAMSATLEARRLLLPESAWWRDDFIAELTSFPAGAHHDWVDATSQALIFINSNPSWREHFEAIKQLNLGLRTEEDQPVNAKLARLAGAPEAFVRHFERRPQPPGTSDGAEERPGESLIDIYWRAGALRQRRVVKRDLLLAGVRFALGFPKLVSDPS